MKIENKSLETNPNIGALGKASYQENNRRVKGFCPIIVEGIGQYIDYVNEHVLPVVRDNPETSRIIDRALVRNSQVEIGQKLDGTELTVEAVVPLGGQWDGVSWVMAGTNFPGRIHSFETMSEIHLLTNKAAAISYQSPKSLPEGYKIESVKESGLSDSDLLKLSEIFKASYTAYLSDLFVPKKVKEWAEDASTNHVIARNQKGVIVEVTNGDLGSIDVRVSAALLVAANVY